MIFQLFTAVFIFGIAIVGTMVGNVLRLIFIPKQRQRYTAPGSNELIITGVLSNGLLAGLIALLSGKRHFWGAFVGGVVLTLILGNRLDQKPLDRPVPMKPQTNAPPYTPSPISTQNIMPDVVSITQK